MTIKIIILTNLVVISNNLITLTSGRQFLDLTALIPMRLVVQPSINGGMRNNVRSHILTTEELLKSKGYDYEEHRLRTEDGFLIRVHRIVVRNRKTKGPPVMLSNGFGVASDTWLIVENDNCLVCQLANSGFDVWMVDRRGNWYSREHVKYKPNQFKFWDFSFHESGYYDLAVAIDRILNVTQYEQVSFIGHSLGTTEYLVLASARPEYSAKIRAAVLLAPVATTPTMHEINSPFLRFLLLYGETICKVAISTGFFELLPRVKNFSAHLREVCSSSSTQDICLDFLGIVFGEHRTNLNFNKIGNQVMYIGSGISIKTAEHLRQMYTAGFGFYDYGPLENLRRYKNATRPLYQMQQATAPVAIFWSDNDSYLNENSIKQMEKLLPNVILNQKVEDPKFTHLDYVLGMNAFDMIYNKVIRLLKSVK